MRHLLPGLSSLLFLLVASPAFDTNDDAVSMFTSCGFWTGRPGDALIFPSLHLSRALRWLYEIWPAPNWYVLLQYAVLFASNTVVVSFFLRPSGQEKPPSAIAAWLWTAVFFLPALLRPQYTVTACWAGLAGWLLLVRGLRKPGISPILFCGAAVFLFFSALIRFQAFLGLGLLMSGLSALLVFEKSRFQNLRIAGLKKPVLALTVLLLPAWLHWQESRERPENAALSYQNAIDAVVNGPNCLDSGRVQAAGFSANDWVLLQKWFWIDGRVFAPEKLERLGRGIRCARSWPAGWRHFAGAFYVEWQVVAGIFICAWLSGMFGATNRRRTWLVAGYVAVLFLALAFWSRLPYRVMFPLIAAAFAWLWINRTDRKTEAPSWRFYAGLAGVLLFQGICLWQVNTKNRQRRQEFREAADWIGRQPETLFVVQGGSFPYEGSFSWKNPALQWTGHNLAPTGYLLHTPAFRDILVHHGEQDLATAILEKRPLALINPPVDPLRFFYREHYGRVIALRPVESGVRIEGRLLPVYNVQ